jgi:hypothetical protein
MTRSNSSSAAPAPSARDILLAPPAGWLPVAAAARALGKSASSIRSRCQAGTLAATLCRGVYGPEWFVDPSAVPALRLAGGDVATPAVVGDSLAGLSEAKRRKIYEQFNLVQAWETDLAAKPAEIRADRWMAQWCRAQRGLGHRVSPPTVYRWRRKVATGGIAALADHRGGFCHADWSPEALQFIVGQYCDESRPSIALCFERAEAVAASQGWTLPSRATVRRHIRRHVDPKLIAAGRDPRRMRDRCLPDIRRDWSLVNAMDLWVADHRQLDVWVPRRVLVDELSAGRKTGRKTWRWSWFRPWLTMFLDAATWYPVAWDLRFESPDANQVMSVFCRGVQLYGKPRHAYLDNGKDFRAARFAGGRRRSRAEGAEGAENKNATNRFFPSASSAPSARDLLPESAVTPILEMLGIGVTWALPYNAKAKVIEPWFRFMSERFDRTFETYLGNKPERRPERIKAMSGQAERYYNDGLTLESMSESFTRWVQDDMVHRECPVECRKPLSTAQAFQQCRAADFVEARPPEQDLALLLMPSQRVVVSKNGIYVKAHDRLYWSDDLLDRTAASGRDARRHIVYRYRTDDDSHIYVFDALTGKYLCNATPFTGDKLHPVAPAGSWDEKKLSQAMEFKGRVAKALRDQSRDLKRASFEVLLTAQRDGARAGGRLVLPTPPVAPPAPVAIQITPQISRAAADAARDKADDDARRENRRQALRGFLRTGTDAADAAPKAPARSALDILADSQEL